MFKEAYKELTNHTVGILITLVIIFLLTWVFTFETTKEYNIKITSIKAIFFNKPQDFSIIYQHDSNIIQERYTGLNIKICDDCQPYIMKECQENKNLFNVTWSFCNKTTLYIQNVQTVSGGQIEIGGTRGNYEYNHPNKIYEDKHE